MKQLLTVQQYHPVNPNNPISCSLRAKRSRYLYRLPPQHILIYHFGLEQAELQNRKCPGKMGLQ
ncbi:hypothetical protein HOLleu_22456 [Holothuria leucospilota]|uniref:Uncharacterized protein n=1 Tax=Holothuria leucospilota TaxID=206669 RepID=A0A9Q1BXP1_HOLLE|nr:hypothetical protein HOLleu_22456 [Holothuria leucospilota]